MRKLSKLRIHHVVFYEPVEILKSRSHGHVTFAIHTPKLHHYDKKATMYSIVVSEESFIVITADYHVAKIT